MAWNDDLSHWHSFLSTFIKDILNNMIIRKEDVIMKSNFKKAIINSLFIGIGLILHQIAPPLLLGMKPDLSLTMMFIIILINDDYRTTLLSGIVCGILTALTTTFPGGQIPNVIDKIVTAHLIYLMLLPLRNRVNNQIKTILVTSIGTIISGAIFLGSAAILAGLPGSFSALFLGIVLPATLVNTIVAPILYNAINLSIKRSHVKIFEQ